MIGKELLKAFEEGKKMTVKFTEDVVELVSQFQKNMKADIIDIKEDNGCIFVKLDQTKYYENNKKLGINTWYNNITGKYDLSYEDYCKQDNMELDMIEGIFIDYEKELRYFNIV